MRKLLIAAATGSVLAFGAPAHAAAEGAHQSRECIPNNLTLIGEAPGKSRIRLSATVCLQSHC